MPADGELVKEILNGSQAAMEVLVRRHYRNIFAYVYRKTGEYHAACDLTQDIFMAMLKALPRYREKERFDRWLLVIAVNRCRDYHRSRGARTGREGRMPPDLPDLGHNVWELFSKKAERERVKAALEQLPPLQKEVILLRFYHDLKIREIARITQAGEATVKSRLREGLSKLKSLLAEKEGEAHGCRKG